MDEPNSESQVVKRAFGEANRNRLIDLYFSEAAPTGIAVQDAWKHVYRLLLWIDRTTGLAHCYESDKSQPGKPWYARSLAFHSWLASEFGQPPKEVASQLDWLFQKVSLELASEARTKRSSLEKRAEEQRASYNGIEFPRAGEDPELIAIVRETIGDDALQSTSEEAFRLLVERVRLHIAVENKRKNLVGEGFEDILAQVIRRSTPSGSLAVSARRTLADIPGFSAGIKGGKPNKVDLSILKGDHRTLVTAKWSVRADRERQFSSDLTEYVQSNTLGRPFDYVLVTNEFDPARLVRACDQNVAQRADV